MIAFDNASNSNNGAGGSLTYSHTVGSGKNRLLVVGVSAIFGDVITGVTYAGEAMTLQMHRSDNSDVYTFYLLNPASGTNNIVVSRTGTNWIWSVAASYTGVRGLDNSVAAKWTGSSSPIVESITPAGSDNCWAVWVAEGYNGLAASTGATSRANESNRLLIADNNGAIHPPATVTFQATWGGDAGQATSELITFAPIIPKLPDSITRPRPFAPGIAR